MASIPDLYEVLGVAHNASDDEIRKAYRRLARELHPDVNADPEAEHRFKQITAAYQTLSDPARRRQYDMFGARGGQIPADFFPFGDMGDLFDVFFGSGFGGSRRGTTRRRSRTMRGEDLGVRLTLAFEEAAFGVTREVKVDSLEACARCQGTGCEPGTHPSRCRRCGGSGQLQDMTRSVFGTVMTARPCTTCEGTGEEIAAPCKDCGGDGRVSKAQTISVEVPAGVIDGMELRISGGGQEGRLGGGPGDLYVSLEVQPHPVFERRGQDLVCALAVPMTQAALGAEVEIPTLEGAERLKLDPGIGSGTVLRLRGKGVPNVGRRGRGDLFVTVMVETPNPQTKEERALLERLAEARGERPTKGHGVAGKLRKLLEK
jgi:molecular chaperone DnaJ